MKTHDIRQLNTAEEMRCTYEIMRALNNKMTEEEYYGFCAKFIASGYTQHVLFDNDKPVSAIGVIDTPLMGVVPNNAYKIANVATLPEYRGTGVSLALFSHVTEARRAQGYVDAHLNCDRLNIRGREFYKKAGWINTTSDTWTDKILVEKRLQQKMMAKL